MKTTQILDCHPDSTIFGLYQVDVCASSWFKRFIFRSKLFGFIPTGGEGDFNIDVKNVNSGVIATLQASKH